MSRELATVLVSTVVIGSLYALVGTGFVVLYRATKVMNFAQGAFMLVGGEVFYSMTAHDHLAWGWALLIVLAVSATIGAATYALFFARLAGTEPFVLAIASLGLSVVISTIVAIVWGPGTHTVPEVMSSRSWFSFGNFSVSRLDVFEVVFAFALIVVLDLLFQRSTIGTQMRAVADSSLLASQVRINVHRTSTVAWIVAAICAGGAGVMYVLRIEVDPVGVQSLGLVAFPAVFLGGLDSIRGALLGGFALALAQNITTYLTSGLWSNVVAYAILLLVLLVRPNGIFGSRQVARL